MKYKSIVKIWGVGLILSFCGGFISGFNDKEDGLSVLLTSGGYLICLVATIICMVRLWKTPDNV